MSRVAFLGTGIMGAPMARNLVAADHEVRVWNRSREKAEGLGAGVADSPAEAADGAEVVVTMLSDGPVVESVMEGVSLSGDQVWWQASTVGGEATERLHGMAGEAAFVDGPVLGTKQPAEKGELTVLASGPGRDRLGPVFDAVAARVVDLGDEVGAGSRLKLVLNAWIVALVEGLAETVAFAEGIGVDPAKFLEVIEGGPMGPPYAQLKGKAMIERSFDPSFTLSLAAKDAALVADAAAAAGMDLPLPGLVRDQMRKAIDAGHGELDMAATFLAACLERSS
jgi:3-hydroxyisobutyrate dehydrogenase